jgi:molybdopterin-guanine dinucleotide biosynthesis adapter protein
VALVNPRIFQIVGYQNSGKTTIITKILNHLKAKGIPAAVIKHHGHGGKPDVYEQKDSARHIENGAIASIVEGDGRIILQAEKTEWTLEEEIQVIKCFRPEIILIEGYKKESYPKLLIVKEQDDIERLMRLDNIRFILVWDIQMMEQISQNSNIPCFHIHDQSGFHQMVTYIQKKIN